MSDYSEVGVKCPFFSWCDGKKRIVCEGIINGTSLETRFQKKENLKKHMSAFCCKRYNDCNVAKMLNDHYRENV